jgi:methionyl-tRNA synthetase
VLIDDWYKRSWYPTNHAFNFYDKSSVSRWTDRNETSFIDVEKDIHQKFTTNFAKQWKKFSNKKQGSLDVWYEPVCRRFLIRYIEELSLRPPKKKKQRGHKKNNPGHELQ